ncbi:MAG: type II/IV secretion system protein [Gammaproteobacteria bacterium]|nr:GspE/PulE family protein [Gammaproteobacteria bacterium]MBU6509405.1 GspE/PulE family protein [Gammaproteobacteria bacterium]MDE1983787.1 type II/IV secretion system protein [Gammaproteobacteria bacterium]MDE2107764.1 type II/IV secretion system protein [Gammaproteobacteria bacterium]MDE2460742.1 type II/IV secretion system protein [Gammaproteobacteria bacterium]
MASTRPVPQPVDRKLSLLEVLGWIEAEGMLTAERVNLLRGLAERGVYDGQHPLSVIGKRGWPDARDPERALSVETLTQWLAERLKLSYLRIDPLKLDVRRITGVISQGYASRFKVLPVEVTADEIVVATAEPYEREWEREISQIQRKKIRRVLVNPDEISRYLVEFYSISRSVIGAEAQNLVGAAPGIQNFEQLIELSRAGKLDANDQHVVSIVDWLLQYAFDQRASDIHIEPRREVGLIRLRIDGVLHQVYQLPTVVLAPVTSRIKILARMDIAEKRRPQDGRIKTRNPNGQEVELRISSMPTAFGEKLVMRIFDPTVLLRSYRELGISEPDEKFWQAMIENPHGIILVTGPTGSGKTTTLYTTLKQLAQPDVNVCTVEDPIEMVDPALNQMQVQPNIDLTFASGVRTLLRQDPDIIMIGEIRDSETADMAVQASLTGHLVLSTLHTNDAPSSVSRLLDLGVPPYLLQSTLLAVIAQRLVRTLCPNCKQAAELSDEEWDGLVAPWKAQNPKHIYKAAGCLECRNTGYKGRIGLYEMMSFSPAIKKLITSNFDIDALRQEAMRSGMKPLRLRGAQKVAEGVTTVEEVLRVVPPPTTHY